MLFLPLSCATIIARRLSDVPCLHLRPERLSGEYIIRGGSTPVSHSQQHIYNIIMNIIIPMCKSLYVDMNKSSVLYNIIIIKTMLFHFLSDIADCVFRLLFYYLFVLLLLYIVYIHLNSYLTRMQ